MLITDFITEDCIVTKLKARNKADALKELTNHLFETKKLKNAGPALDQILARETTESTGIGHGIAVPHARVSGLKSLICAVGRIDKGLDFMAVDKNPVHLVFLICYPPTQQTTYLNFIATISKLLREEDHMKALLEAKTDGELFSLLENLSASLVKQEETYESQVKTDPDLMKAQDAHADLVLLARLQLCQEMYETARTGKKQIKQRIENIRAMIDPRILKHYDRLTKGRAPALVPVEGDTCQGCFMKLPSQYAQRVRQDNDHIHTCNNCSRFIYIV
ncbi:MAG: PTS sugar transporter subunit IIA [Candidatus Hydrogenedentes bacterium]|nr:PTS sugar transporter subunit IIA [Candidatus Hydrogenedentota bacterium]